LDRGALRASLELIQSRHDVLRSRCPSDDDGPYALVEPECELPLAFVDLVARPDREIWARTLAAEAAAASFDLEAGPLWRLLLVRLAREEHLLVLVMHHLVSDGWSLRVFAGELRRAYAAALAGEDAGLPDLGGGFFSVTGRRERKLTADRPRLSAYWRERLAGFPAEVALPRQEGLAEAGVGGGTVDLVVRAEIASSLERLCAREGATRFAALVASLAILLRGRSGQRRLLFTTPIANRDDELSLHLIGCFLNTVPLALELSDELRLRDVLRHAQEVLAGALANGHLPFADIVAAAAGERSRPTRPLGNVMLLENNAPLEGLDLTGLRVERQQLPVTAVKHDLAITLARTAAGITGQIEYSDACFSAATARRLGADFVQVAAALASRPDLRLGDLLGAEGPAQ
jgi:hypothetical protein